LIRETLAKVEADLAAAGFLRTHRSWLVNPAHVRAVTPAAAGDFKLELDGGLTAPLSRRFPAALESLRAPQASLAEPPVPQT
jgi:DNA-binding LytR/AlgR family response regulator